MRPGGGATVPGPLGALWSPFACLTPALGVRPVTLPLRFGRFVALGDCLRCSTTFGACGAGERRSGADGFEGSPIGTVVVPLGAPLAVVGAVVVGAVVVVVLGGCSVLP